MSFVWHLGVSQWTHPACTTPAFSTLLCFLRFLATSLSPILHPRSSSAMICVKKLGMRTWALTLQLKQASCITWLCFSFPFLSFTAVFIQAYWLHPYKSNDFSIRISVRFSLQTSWVLEDKGVLYYCWLVSLRHSQQWLLNAFHGQAGL